MRHVVESPVFHLQVHLANAISQESHAHLLLQPLLKFSLAQLRSGLSTMRSLKQLPPRALTQPCYLRGQLRMSFGIHILQPC
jgi:hypothetical protein